MYDDLHCVEKDPQGKRVSLGYLTVNEHENEKCEEKITGYLPSDSSQFCLFYRCLLNYFGLNCCALLHWEAFLRFEHVVFPESYAQIFTKSRILHQFFRLFVKIDLNLHLLVFKIDDLVLEIQIFDKLNLTIFGNWRDLDLQSRSYFEISEALLGQISLISYILSCFLKPTKGNFSLLYWIILFWHLHRLSKLNSQKTTRRKTLNNWNGCEFLNFFCHQNSSAFLSVRII